MSDHIKLLSRIIGTIIIHIGVGTAYTIITINREAIALRGLAGVGVCTIG
jgi:hypothetical protein